MNVNDDPALGPSRSNSMKAPNPDATGRTGRGISKLAQEAHFIPHDETCAVNKGIEKTENGQHWLEAQ